MVYSTSRFVLSLALCYFVPVFFSHFSIAITSLGEERADLSAFSYFCSISARFFFFFFFLFVCLFPLPLGVWEWLWLMIVAFPGLFSYFLYQYTFVRILEMLERASQLTFGRV